MTLSATYGIHRTAKALRLNADSLKKRAAAGGGRVEPPDGTCRRLPKAAATFVELLPSGSPCSPECVIELEDPRGAKMRIHLKGNQDADVVAAISKVFWSAEI